jgi:hypothetical protein
MQRFSKENDLSHKYEGQSKHFLKRERRNQLPEQEID